MGLNPFEKFGAEIRSKRIEQELSRESLASFSNLHTTYIGSIERGERNVSLKNILALCEALQIKPSELMACLDEIITKDNL